MRGLLILFVFLAAFTCSAMQDSAPAPAAQPSSPYFSGYVAEMNPGSLTVRKKIGQTKERRVFLMDSQTKIEGKLRSDVRVTVRFESGPSGDRALHIIVRDR